MTARTAAAVLLAALASPAPATAVHVLLEQPRPGQPVFGEVKVEAEVSSDRPVRGVQLVVDQRFVSRLEKPPYRWLVDVGEENAEHRFEVLAEDVDGATALSVLVTPQILVDSEIRVELQQLYVTVTVDGEPVLDLGRHQFTVRDRGERQRLITFERGQVPLTALLLMDASESMLGEHLAAAAASAGAFIDGMQPLDQAMLLLFSDRVVHSTPFTGFQRVLATGLEDAEAQGGTALNDHLYVALRLLEERQGRRVVILMSDGLDSASVLSMREVLATARRSQAMLYWIRLQPPERERRFSSAWLDPEGYRDELRRLEQAVQQSGGRIIGLPNIEAAGAAFDEILADLRGQYVLGYYPDRNLNDGSWHPIKVDIAGSGDKVRVRKGYFDY